VNRVRRDVFTATAVLAGFSFALWFLRGQGLRFNVSESEPIGIYWMQSYKGEALSRSALIEFCPPVKQKDFPFTSAGNCDGGTTPFLKHVIGVPGDRVRVGKEGVFINEHLISDSQAMSRAQSSQTTLSRWDGDRVLGNDEYWVYGAGDSKDSFDSRYFGPVKAGQIISIELIKRNP